MTADPRLTAAREYLAYAQGQRISHLPPPVLQRMAAELRRQLGQVLTLAGDYEDDERGHDVTGLTPSGGARISPAGVLVLASALADAARHRAAGGGDLAAYLRLAAELGIEVDR